MTYPLFITFTTGTKIIITITIITVAIFIITIYNITMLIPKFIILNLAHSFTFFSIFFNLFLDGYTI